MHALQLSAAEFDICLLGVKDNAYSQKMIAVASCFNMFVLKFQKWDVSIRCFQPTDNKFLIGKNSINKCLISRGKCFSNCRASSED